METILSLCLGLGLAAACGLRVFIPVLAVGAAARLGYVELGDGFVWLASTPALVTLGVATLLEVAAYHVPWLDHLLDTLASPLAVVAGVLLSASVFVHLDPVARWTLALIAGGGLAASTQATTVAARHLSTLGTGGLINPLLASFEAMGAAGLAVLAIVLPLLALLLVVLVLLGTWRILRRRRRSAAAT